MRYSGLQQRRNRCGLRNLLLVVIRYRRETCRLESIGSVFRRRIGLNSKLEVLGGVRTAVQFLRDVARVIEDLRALNSNRDGLLHRGIRVLKLRIGIERPGVCIQRPHILPRCNLLLRKFQRIGRGGGASGIHQNEVESRLVCCCSGLAGQLLELRIRGASVLGLSCCLLRSCQLIEDVRIAIDRCRLHPQLNRIAALDSGPCERVPNSRSCMDSAERAARPSQESALPHQFWPDSI